jgi:hypothetical protein
MALDAMMLGVYKIPEITVDTGTDWVTFAGTILTVLVVFLGTWTTNKNFKTTTKAQERLAQQHAHHQLIQTKAEAVSKNRQEWINSLRVAISNFTGACFELRSIDMVLCGPSSLSAVTPEEAIAAATLHREIVSKHFAKKGEARKYLSEIELLINPTEQASSDMVEVARNMYQGADNEGNIFILSEMLIEKSQRILKTEWERVKQMV